MSTRTISTLEELKAFRDEVNAGNTFKGETIELANDIDLGGEEWTPIGTQSHQFQGIFNGNGHTISNLKINTPYRNDVGFFGFTTNGEIKNLTFNNAEVTGYCDVGVVAGTPYTSKYSNITLTGDIKVSGYAYVGGMFGKNAYADLTDLTINANAGSYVKADSEGYRTYVGGIVGFMGEGNQTVMNVISNINVIGSTCDIGGITGIAHYGNKFINVICTAELIQLVNANDEGDHLEIGGIAGVWLNTPGQTVLLLNCSAENTTLKSSLNGEDRSEDVKDNDITGRSYSEETSTSGSLIIGNVRTTETGSEYVFTVSGPKAADDLKAIFGDSLQDNGDGTYTSTTFDMSAIYVNEAWAGKKNGDMVEYGIIGVNAFVKANDAINAAGANATINILDARSYDTPITRASYTENLTIEKQEKGYSQLYMTVSGTTYTYGEEDENGNAVRHDATVEYKGQDIFFGGHSHFESLAGMTVKFTNSEITHEGGTPFFKVYGDSNVVFDGANYANDNGNLWFYVSGQLDLLNSSHLETHGGSGFRILAAGGKVNVDNRASLRVYGSNISIGSYYVYGDKTAKAVVGGKKQGHDADGNNDYSATLNITNVGGLINDSIVRVGASYILDNATTDELEGLTITDNPDKPANYAELAKAYLNITDGSGAELNRLYVDGNGVVTIRNAELTANSITLADNSAFTLDAAATVTVGALAVTGTINASSIDKCIISVKAASKIKASSIVNSNVIYMIDEDTYLEAENIQLTDEVAGKVALRLYDGATAVIRDTLTVGKGAELVISGSNLGACSVTAKNVIHNGSMTIGGWSQLTAENITVSAGSEMWGMSGSMITVTNSLVVENYGDLYFTIGNVAGNANVVTLIKGYEGIDYTNVDVRSTEGYVKVVGNDNNLYAIRGNADTFVIDAAWKDLTTATEVSFDGKNYIIDFNAFASMDGILSRYAANAEANEETTEIIFASDAESNAADNAKKYLYTNIDMTFKAAGDTPVTVTVHGQRFYLMNVYDLDSEHKPVKKDNMPVITIDKNVNLVTDGILMLGQNVDEDDIDAYGNPTRDPGAVKLVVNGSVKAYHYYVASNSELLVTETGKILKGGEAFLTRAGSTVTVNGDGTKADVQFENSYTSMQGGVLNLNNTYMTTGQLWIRSASQGFLREGSTVNADNTRIEVSGSADISADSVLKLVNGTELIVSNDFTNAGTITIDALSSITTGEFTAADASITVDMTNYTDGLYKLINVTGNGAVDYSKILTNFDSQYLTVVDNDLWIGIVDRSTLLADSTYADKYQVGEQIEGMTGFYYGFNAFASAETMFDNIRDTTTTLKLFGEQELVTDAATGAANNRNFNIRAKQDLTLTADEAATLTLTVKDSSWEHGGSTNSVGELAFLSDSDDAIQTITIGENVTIDTNAKIWFGRTAVTKEVHATNIVINGSIIQKPHKDATSEHPNSDLYGIHQIQVEKGSTVTLNGSMLFGWSLLVKGGTFNVTENASLTWDVDAFAQTNGNVEVESRDTTGGQFNVSGSKNVNLRSLTIKDSASSASFTNGAEAIFIDYITLVEGSAITIDAASTVITGTLTNNGTITIDATGVTSGTHKVIDTDSIATKGSITAKDGTLADDMNLVIADNDVYLTDQNQDIIYVGGINAAGEKSANTTAPSEALQGWNKFDTMKDAFEAGALGYNTIDFGNAGRVVSDKAFTYTKETIELGEGEYTITNGAGAYLPRLTMNARDVVINIKNAHVTLAKYRSGKDSNGELGGATLNITNSRVDGGNEVDGLMWVTSYADSIIEITNSMVGLRDDYTGEAETVALGNTGSYLDWGSYGNLALKVSGIAVIKDSTIFAGYYFSTIGDSTGATIDVTNSVVYACAVETDGTDGMASLSLNNSALRQSGWGNGTENYNFLVKKGATVSLTNGSNLWWARAAQVRSPYGGDLRDSVVIDAEGKLELFGGSTAEVGNITNNGELVIYKSTLKAMTITNNGYFAINGTSAITAEFSAAGTGYISIQDAVFGADTVINASASYTNQGIGSEILMFGTTILANGANISTGWDKNLRIGFGSNFPSAAISITSGAKLTVGGSTYIGSATESQGDAAYNVFVTGAGSEFNGSGASGDLYLRADGMLTIQNEASASFSYFNGKGVLNVLNATFKSLNFNIADSAKLSFANGAKVTLGSTTTASTARGDISVGGDETELNLIGDIKYGRTNTAADFTVKNNATVTVDGNIEIGYFTQTSGVMAFYKGSLSLTDNARFTTTGTITVFLESAIAMDYTSRLTFGGLTAQNGAITIDVSGYTDGIYMVMENTGSNTVDYATVISNWSEIENIGYTIVDNALYIGKADSENYLVNADYSKYKFGDAIEGKAGYFYGFNAFSSLDDAGRAAKEATKTITVEADLTEDVNTPLFDLKGDLILTAESPVTVTWNVIGNAADAPDTDGKFYLVSKDGLNHTFTIGENVTLNIPQSSWGGAFYVGYQSAWATKLNIDGKVNTYLFYIGSKSEVTISETGSLTTTSENLIMRWDSKLTVNGNGTLDENNPQVKLSYASIQGGDLVLNNTVMNAGSWLQMWNRNKEDGKQAPTLTLDNSILIASGLTARDAEEAVISLNNNSTVKINGNADNAGTMSVTDSVLYVDGTLTNSGTINIYGESTINTVGVANTGMIILNDGTTLVDSTIMDSTENTVAYGNVTVRNSHFGTLVFSGNSGASVNGTLEGTVYVDNLMVDRRYNDAVSDDITGTLTVKAGANVGVSKHMYNKVGSTTVIEANATVTVTGELQNKGTINVEGTLYLFSENGLGESVAGRDKNKGVMNVNGGNVYYADSSSSNGWFGIGTKIHNAGWQDVEEAGSEMNLSNNAVLDLTFNSSNGYPTKYGAAFAIGTGATLNVESGSTVNANSALLNKGTVNLDETSKITVGDLINEATGKISVKAGTDVSFKAGTLTNNGEFAVDGSTYNGGTVKIIDLDAITGAEIIVNNIDSKYVYRGDDGDILFSDASKEILKGNSRWTEEFGEAVADAGNGFYMGVNAFNNAAKLSAEFKRDESVKEIQLTERLTGKLALERGVTISSDRFFGEAAFLGGTDAEYTLNVSYNQTWERFEIGGQNVTVTLKDNGSASLQAHTLNIGSGAEVIVTDGATLYASEINTSGAITGGTLNNWGTITLEAGSALQVGRSAVAGWFNNYGLINVNDATITVFAANFKNEGTITVSAGSTVETSEFFINQGTFNLNWNATLKMGNFDATSSSITIDMTGFDNKERAIVVVGNETLDEATVIRIVGQDFYNKYKGYLRYDGNTLYLTENLSAEVYVSSDWTGKGTGETVDYNGNTYTIGTNAFGTVSDAQSVNPLLIHIVGGTITGTTVLDGMKTILDGDATYTAVVLAGARIAAGVDNRVTIDGDTNVTVNSGTFKSHLIGADGQISGSIRRNGNVTLTINGGDFEKQVAGGMYFYAQNPFDEAVLNGDVNMTINGGTFVKRVYGGCFTQLENEYTAQTKIVGDINLTIDASVNTITFNDMVTAGSRGTGRIYGNINVKVTGAGSNLNFTTKLIGDSNAAGYYNTANGYTEQTYVSGDRIVEFANFQGDFNAELIMFKTLNFSEGTNMTFTSVRLDVSNVSEWNFGFGTELNINAGLNSFEGDELAFGLDGWDNSSDWTAINGAKDSMIAGWDKAGSVSFILNGSEYAASWDAAAGAWCNSELGVKLGLGDDQKSLLISKLA